MFRHKKSSIKRWLQTGYVSKWYLNAIEGRWEKYNYLRGVVLFAIGAVMVIFSFTSFTTSDLTRDNVAGAITLFVVLFAGGFVFFNLGAYQMNLRVSHRQRLSFLIEDRPWFIHLISDDDIIFKAIMSPELEAYLANTTLKALDPKVKKVLLDYSRAARDREKIFKNRLKKTASALRKMIVKHEYEFSILSLAQDTGIEIAKVLDFKFGQLYQFYDYREWVWTSVAREEISAAMVVESADMAAALDHLTTLE